LCASVPLVRLSKDVMNAKRATTLARRPGAKPAKPSARSLLPDVRELILQAREGVARTVDAGLALHYWQVGRRIRRQILHEKRAEYGKEIVVTLSQQLTAEFGNGYSRFNLARMIQFAEVFPETKIVVTLSRQLGWSHFVALLPIADPLQRDFYAEMCRMERWNVRTLRKKIGGMLFERTALSRKPDQLIRQELAALRKEDRLTPDLVFRDPYFLDFLGLKDTYAEKDIEAAILREMESFILELGVGFCFVARQLRM
jgi:predicted nuclease of restriction endonuclease-like (RecB) superfamily